MSQKREQAAYFSLMTPEAQNMFREKTVSFLEDIRLDDIQRFGGKAVNTSRLLQGGFKVPSGFSISAECFDEFTQGSPVRAYIERLDRTDDLEEMLQAAIELEQVASDYELPPDLEKQILDAVSLLERRVGGTVSGYAVRSSATVEDGSSFSFAGQAETHLCVRDHEAILQSVKSVWLSALTPRAVLYLKSKGVPPSQVRMSVIVQQMIPADISGVLFTANVVTGERKQALVEAIHGLGEPLVGGKVTPDTYILDKETLDIVEERIGKTDTMLIAGEHGSSEVPLPDSLRGEPVLDHARLRLLLDTGLKIEEMMGYPQDIEWCIHENRLVILQSRPITTL